jgi:tetratricopeptide (TPR) repeat protein
MPKLPVSTTDVLLTAAGRPEVMLRRAIRAGEEGRWDDAIQECQRILAIDPTHLDTVNYLAIAYGEKGNLWGAMLQFDNSLQIDPNQPAMWRNRGLALLKIGRPQDAILCFDRLIALLPEEEMGYALRAETLLCLGSFPEALTALDQIVKAKPDDANTAVSRGVALQWCGRMDEAYAEFDRAIGLEPDNAVGWLNKALLSLLLGDLPGGFRLFERRWGEGSLIPNPVAVKPLWLGETDIAGKTLLLHAEQGLGDTLQFCRYATMAARAGARVILVVPSPLATLMETVDGVSQVIDETEPPPDHDLQCPLMSLPLAFGTSVETIPAKIPYLHAAPDAAAKWRERLSDVPGRRVGLVWAGSARAGHALLASTNFRRSLPFTALAPLASVEGCTFVSLQLGPPAREAANAPGGLFSLDYTDELKTFADTAALIESLDLVISADTAAAHLAGAMGKPVWVLNRFDNCWRWMLNRNDSPWYPTMRLFRQPRPGDWNSVVRAVAAALREFVAA